MSWNEATRFRTIQRFRAFFPGSSNKIKFLIFHNIPERSINVLIPFNYVSTCELYGRTQYKNKRGKIRAKKRFVLLEEVVDYFNRNFISPQYKCFKASIDGHAAWSENEGQTLKDLQLQ